MTTRTATPAKSLEQRYRDAFAASSTLYLKALERFPNGVTHDGRFMRPFPIYVNRAAGSRKWDVDGHELIDYWMGHGSLLFGHSHPTLVRAITEQAEKGTHYGACHELEIAWAERVNRLMPIAEKVRFVASGTEATLMAIRLARTFTGRRRVIKFYGHYHGWHDNVMDGVGSDHDRPMPGVLPEVFETLISLPDSDLNRVEETMKHDPDIACILLEPTGALFGGTEVASGVLQDLRFLTEKYGVVFIMDEVVTGFRCAPGGAQEFYGVKPDLCTLAKILAGGLPGGAVAGREDLMELLEIRSDPVWQTTRKMTHYGTFNANPLSAAAGVAALDMVASGEAIKTANARAFLLREKLSGVLERHGLSNWRVYGNFSGVKISASQEPGASRRGNLTLIHALRQGMLLHGVDMVGVDGLTSSAHTLEDIERTASAFDSTLSILRQENIIPS